MTTGGAGDGVDNSADPAWAPEGIDVERPSPARIYDYILGGAHNFAVDRQVAEQTMAVMPDAVPGVRANRAFLRRAVQYLADAGVRQYLDIGSGIPTVGHVHEIAQATVPEARVVYVDIDPVAVAHSREILAGNDQAVAVQEDVRRPEQILAHPDVLSLLDFTQPVAVLVVALFHFVADDAGDLIARLMRPLASGSHLAVSHGTDDGPLDTSRGKEIYRASGIEITTRTRHEVEALFGDLEMVEPGVVWVPLWRPESADDVNYDRPEYSGIYAGVGRKR